LYLQTLAAHGTLQVASMIRIVLSIVMVTVALSTLAPTAHGQPILKRVEEMLRDQLGGQRPAKADADRGYLGMIADDTPQNIGVVVLEVYPGQPADQGGLAAGDVITSVDSRPIRTMDELVSQALDKPVGTKLAMVVSRNGETKKLQITLGRRPTEPGSAVDELPAPTAVPNLVPPSGPRLGVRSVAVTADVQQQHNLAEAAGAHVIYVTPDSPAAKANVPLGAVITAVDDFPVKSPEELAAAIRSSTKPTVELTFVHAGRTQRVTANLGTTADMPPALVETQARKAQPPTLVPPVDTPPAARPTPPPPQPDPPAPKSAVSAKITELLDRIDALERRVEALEAKQGSE
jgi:S1-C subfamily serine protease